MPTSNPDGHGALRPAHWVLLGGAFVVLATANGAGYRFGGSDQAFYIPAVQKALDPATFPRDAALIDAQGALILVDEAIAYLARLTGLSLDALFLAGYVMALATIWAGVVLIGSRLYGNVWLTLALGAAFTLRHRIARTSANSFEPYFHPRMLAFGIGLLATAALLRRRPWVTIALVATAALVHATTAIWFAVLLGVALAVGEPRLRPLIAAAAVAVTLFMVWAVTAGPLGASWTVMDSTWLQAVATKDSLFADQWPWWAWLANLGLLPLVWLAHRARVSAEGPRPLETALAWGATALVVLFLVTLPAVLARLAFAVEFQISRVFWPLDFVATAYLIAAVGARRPEAIRGLAAFLLVFSLGRGLYVMYVENPERPLFALRLAATPWQDAMEWVARQPVDLHVLADPGHAWKHGTSVRVSGRRDVFLEEVKDSALAIYSRDVAVRVVERTDAVGDFTRITGERARELARRYRLDVLITTAELDLPVAYQNRQFRIYSLR